MSVSNPGFVSISVPDTSIGVVTTLGNLAAATVNNSAALVAAPPLVGIKDELR
mgnify:CR=1 FL=1